MPQQVPAYEGLTVGWRCGDGGLNTNLNPSRILFTNIIQAEGTVFYDDDWRKEPGTILFGQNTTSSDPFIVALFDWHPIEGTSHIVHLAGDGKVYSTTAGNPNNPTAAVSATGVSAVGTRQGFFVTAGSEDGTRNRKLFLFRNNLLPWYLDGDTSTLTALTGLHTPIDWSDAQPPITAVVTGGAVTGSTGGGRLCAAGTSKNPHQVYISKLGDHTDFTTVSSPAADTDAQTFSIFPGLGERIYALANYQGLTIVFKYPIGIFAMDLRANSPADWVTNIHLSSTLGVAQSPHAVCPLNNDVVFLSNEGLFYLLSSVVKTAGQPGIEPANLSLDLNIYQYLIQNVDRTHMNAARSVYFPFRQNALFSYSRTQDQGVNHARINFDTARLAQDEGIRVSYSYRDQATALAVRQDPLDMIYKPMSGDALGNILFWEQSGRSNNGSAYNFIVQTPHSNLGEFENFLVQKFTQLAHKRKEFDAVEIEYVALTTATLTLSVYVDGALKQTLLVPIVAGGNILGGPGVMNPFLLNDPVRGLLAGPSVGRSVRRTLNVGSGRRISMALQDNNVNEDVAIVAMFLSFRPTDEAAPRDT